MMINKIAEERAKRKLEAQKQLEEVEKKQSLTDVVAESISPEKMAEVGEKQVVEENPSSPKISAMNFIPGKKEIKSVRKNYILRASTAQKLKELANRYSISENDLINQILDDLFDEK